MGAPTSWPGAAALACSFGQFDSEECKMANIIITGANRGIGLALVKTYLLGGDRVFALCRQPQQADQLNELAASAGGQLTVHPVDMADAGSITTFAGSLKRSEEHTSELQSRPHLVCRLLLEKKKTT